MAGNLGFDQLQDAVREGKIDTVVACFVDMQGRLIGKRFHAEYFLDGAYEETHGCDYLLANDIDMEPVPGYEAANWEKGYGDFVMKPDLATLRRIPGCRAPRSSSATCSIITITSRLPHSPRAMLKEQIERLSAHGMSAYFASELEFYLFDETYEVGRSESAGASSRRPVPTSRTTTSSRPPRRKA